MLTRTETITYKLLFLNKRAQIKNSLDMLNDVQKTLPINSWQQSILLQNINRVYNNYSLYLYKLYCKNITDNFKHWWWILDLESNERTLVSSSFLQNPAW